MNNIILSFSNRRSMGFRWESEPFKVQGCIFSRLITVCQFFDTAQVKVYWRARW